MASGPYEPIASSSFTYNGIRRSSGRFTSPYESNGSRRRAPSPDTYIRSEPYPLSRPTPPFRPPLNQYEAPASYYARPPVSQDERNRGAWQRPPVTPNYQRQPSPRDWKVSTSPARRFEPSDAWKQSQDQREASESSRAHGKLRSPQVSPRVPYSNHINNRAYTSNRRPSWNSPPHYPSYNMRKDSIPSLKRKASSSPHDSRSSRRGRSRSSDRSISRTQSRSRSRSPKRMRPDSPRRTRSNSRSRSRSRTPRGRSRRRTRSPRTRSRSRSVSDYSISSSRASVEPPRPSVPVEPIPAPIELTPTPTLTQPTPAHVEPPPPDNPARKSPGPPLASDPNVMDVLSAPALTTPEETHTNSTVSISSLSWTDPIASVPRNASVREEEVKLDAMQVDTVPGLPPKPDSEPASLGDAPILEGEGKLDAMQVDPAPAPSTIPDVKPELSMIIDPIPTPTTLDPMETLDVVVAPAPRSIHHDPIVNWTLAEIPRLGKGSTFQQYLRTVVMTRLLCDKTTREERVEPLLNQRVPTPPLSSSPADELVREVMARQQQSDKRIVDTREALIKRFQARQQLVSEKAQQLRTEYLALHKKWAAHCADLDRLYKPPPVETDIVVPVTTGRTTRRTANLGDAVRSDLEMEQIIASLGVDDATDPSQLCLRNLAKIPTMISVEKGQVDVVYDDTNCVVQNPMEFYSPDTGVDDWTKEEKAIYLDQFAAAPKQFGTISTFLPHKTARQCVAFYYLHKKRAIDFRKVVTQFAPKRKRRKPEKKGLMSDIRQHDASVSRASPARRAKPAERKPPKRSSLAVDTTPSGTSTPEPEGRPRRRAAARSSLLQEDGDASDVDKRGGRKPKRTRKVKSAATVPASPTGEDGPLTRRKSVTSPTWTDEDKKSFLKYVAQYATDCKKIAVAMGTKTTAQVTNYYKAHLVDLNLADIAAKAPTRPSRSAGSAVESSASTSTPKGYAGSAPPMASLTPDPSSTGKPSEFPPHPFWSQYAQPPPGGTPNGDATAPGQYDYRGNMPHMYMPPYPPGGYPYANHFPYMYPPPPPPPGNGVIDQRGAPPNPYMIPQPVGGPYYYPPPG